MSAEEIKMKPKVKWGLRNKNQLPLLMVWREYYDHHGDVIDGQCLYSSRHWWRGFWKFRVRPFLHYFY